MDIVEFLNARQRDEELLVRNSGADLSGCELYELLDDEGDGTGKLATRGARVLADVAARRAIIAEHEPIYSDLYPEDGPLWCSTCTAPGRTNATWPCNTLVALAQPYLDHPDADPAWRYAAFPQRVMQGLPTD